MKTNAVLTKCFLFFLIHLFFHNLSLKGQCTAGTPAAFIACVDLPATSISVTADYTVNLAGKSLSGIAINLNNNELTITGNPTVNSATSFTGNGASSLTLVATSGTAVFDFNGANTYDDLNTAMDQPVNNSLHSGAVAAGATALPVTLSGFEADMKNASVKLTWQTASELNNEKFLIETSNEGEIFASIGEIQGAGTTTEAKTYQFTHRTPSEGINYYRLKQVDFDGTFEYSKVVAINAPGTTDIFTFPNPAKDKIYVQYDRSKGEGNVYLYDALGRRVNASISGTAGTYELNLPGDAPKGTYWLKVERAGKVQTVPVVKE